VVSLRRQITISSYVDGCQPLTADGYCVMDGPPISIGEVDCERMPLNRLLGHVPRLLGGPEGHLTAG
jgi:hypothetical protein